MAIDPERLKRKPAHDSERYLQCRDLFLALPNEERLALMQTICPECGAIVTPGVFCPCWQDEK